MHRLQNTLRFAFLVFFIIKCLTSILLTWAQNHHLQFLFFAQFPVSRNSTFCVSLNYAFVFKAPFYCLGPCFLLPAVMHVLRTYLLVLIFFLIHPSFTIPYFYKMSLKYWLFIRLFRNDHQSLSSRLSQLGIQHTI